MLSRSASQSKTILSVRALNRALLERQLLLRRSDFPATDAIEHLVGLQSQTPNAPYLALWSRLHEFDPSQLTKLINDRLVVRIALMRGTIHSVTARDCLEMRPLFAPVLMRALQGTFGRRLSGLDLKLVASAGAKLLSKQPRTFSEIGRLLTKRWPDREPEALANVVRALVPLIQVPPRGIWGTGGAAAHVTSETWLGRSLAAGWSLGTMILRYLAAFGPATVRDMQSWSGLTRLAEQVELLRADLCTFTTIEGQELFDLPDSPRPDPATVAPPRFLPVFDNLLLAHADRNRILPETHRKALFGTAALLEGTVLIDGFVGAKWKLAEKGERATLEIEPFEQLRRADRADLLEEGDRLLSFAAPTAQFREIRLSPPLAK
jgi:Winged helix DNA-binding domain